MINKLKFLIIIFALNFLALQALAEAKNNYNFPASFDLRDYNRVTAPKFQNFPGPCWAFAAVSACESNYLTQNFNFINNINLSELHLAYLAYKNLDNKKNFTPFKYKNSGRVLSGEGNAFISTAVLSRLDGLVHENDAPYSLETIKNFNNLKFKNILRVTDVYNLSLSQETLNPDAAKYLIKTHGAVTASFYSDFNKYKAINNFYTYFNNSHDDFTTHDVILIGWDDNFSRNNFLPKPERNGAWLAQNSWGSGWGVNKGCFWISYEQYMRGGIAFITAKPDKLLTHYGYDDLGYCKHLKFNYAANIFKAKSNHETLDSVAFYTTRNNASYEIFIYNLNFTQPRSPVSGNLLFKSSGKIKFAGYHTINLNLKNLNQITFKQGQYFSVIIKLDCPVACESKIKGYTDNFKINKGESFFSRDNKNNNNNWIDGSSLTDPANACIKAFTRKLF